MEEGKTIHKRKNKDNRRPLVPPPVPQGVMDRINKQKKETASIRYRESLIKAALASGMCPYNRHEYKLIAEWCVNIADAIIEGIK